MYGKSPSMISSIVVKTQAIEDFNEAKGVNVLKIHQPQIIEDFE